MLFISHLVAHSSDLGGGAKKAVGMALDPELSLNSEIVYLSLQDNVGNCLASSPTL